MKTHMDLEWFGQQTEDQGGSHVGGDTNHEVDKGPHFMTHLMTWALPGPLQGKWCGGGGDQDMCHAGPIIESYIIFTESLQLWLMTYESGGDGDGDGDDDDDDDGGGHCDHYDTSKNTQSHFIWLNLLILTGHCPPQVKHLQDSTWECSLTPSSMLDL